MIDAKKAINSQIGKVAGCLATHTHKDHADYVKDFFSSGTKIYTNDETKEVIDCAYGEWLYGVLEKEMFKVGGFKATPLHIPHNDIPNYGYLVKHEGMGKLLFAADFGYLPRIFKQQQLNHMPVERNHMDDVKNMGSSYEHVMRGRSNLSVVLGVVRKDQTPCSRSVILCHLNHFNADPKQMLIEAGKVAGSCVDVFYAEAELEAELRKELFQGGNKKC